MLTGVSAVAGGCAEAGLAAARAIRQKRVSCVPTDSLLPVVMQLTQVPASYCSLPPILNIFLQLGIKSLYGKSQIRAEKEPGISTALGGKASCHLFQWLQLFKLSRLRSALDPNVRG